MELWWGQSLDRGGSAAGSPAEAPSNGIVVQSLAATPCRRRNHSLDRWWLKWSCPAFLQPGRARQAIIWEQRA